MVYGRKVHGGGVPTVVNDGCGKRWGLVGVVCSDSCWLNVGGSCFYLMSYGADSQCTFVIVVFKLSRSNLHRSHSPYRFPTVAFKGSAIQYPLLCTPQKRIC